MASSPNRDGKGTTQSGYGKHADRRTRRKRSRKAALEAAIRESDAPQPAR